jgi:hypothetical protein
MSRKWVVVYVTVFAVLLGSALYASNFGFKLNYRLRGPGEGGNAQGWNTIGLPYQQQENLDNAFHLIQDINLAAGSPPGPAAVVQIGNWNKATNSFSLYNGLAGTAFPLVPGDGYLVQVNTGVNYYIVGTNDDDLAIQLGGAAVRANGATSVITLPFNARAKGAFDLITEINLAAGGPAVVQVGTWNGATNSWTLYNGTSGTQFCLLPGQAYLVQTNQNFAWIPAQGPPFTVCP